MKLQSIEKFKEKRQSKLDFKRLCKFKAQTDPSTIDSIEILHKYQNGYNLSEIAKYLGCSRNRAYVICKGYNAKACVQLPDGVIYKVLKLYNKNYTKEKIAKKCKLKLSNVNMILCIEGYVGFTSNEIILDKYTIKSIYDIATKISNDKINKGLSKYLNTTYAFTIYEELIMNSIISKDDKDKLTSDMIIKRLKQIGLYKSDPKFSNRITDEEKKKFYTMYTRDNHTIKDIAKYTHHSERIVSKYIKEYEKELINNIKLC